MNGEHAQILNPAGLSFESANRSLRLAGYTEADIEILIEVVGDDRRGRPVWRWRTDYYQAWEREPPEHRPVAGVR